MLRTGFLGCGTMGRLRAAAAVESGLCQVVGVCDSSPQAAAQLAAQVGAPALDWDSLRGAELDLLWVCTPTAAHVGAIAQAAGQVGAVFCEAPLASSAAGGQAAAAACQRADTLLLVGAYRALPGFRNLRQACASGEVGQAQMFRLRLCDGWPPEKPGRPSMCSELAAPTLEYVAWLLGDLERVYAQASRDAGVVLATARCHSGKLAHLEWNSAQPAGSRPYASLEVAGDAGVLALDSRRDAALDLMVQRGNPGLHAPFAEPAAYSQNPWLQEAQAAARALQGQTTPLLPAVDEVLQSLRAADALQRSLVEGTPQGVAAPDLAEERD
ncbi:MAG: Gfo/Idh/MocA family oxidoreductase [Chloroflexi bacterium]|nr:Gfo/Idh/MocA family oxidoreductase [Chloroflexota bacterium]